MRLDLSADELLTTTRAVRKRLDLARPVEREVIAECIEIAVQAPTGSNSQGWHWVVVTAPETKQALADLYRPAYAAAYGGVSDAPYTGTDPRGLRMRSVKSSSDYLAEHLHEVPAMVIPCQKGRVEGGDNFAVASYWGSILQAVWSFMLALRERGLGSAWTTLHLPNEREAAELLGIDYDRYTQAGLFPVAYTKGTDFKPASRLPMDRILHWDTW
jgi:nitroreductase